MNKYQSALEFLQRKDYVENSVTDLCVKTLKKQISKKVYHFLEDDTFETTCCGIDVTNKDYTYCPNCGSLLGEVEEVEDE